MPFATTLKSIVFGATTTVAAATALTFSGAAAANANPYAQELSNAIPAGYDTTNDCVTVSTFDGWAGVRAAVVCDRYDVPMGHFILFNSPSELYYRFNNVVNNSGTVCHDGGGQRTWYYDATPDRTLGRIVCVTESDGTSAIAWTDDRNLTLNYISSDTTFTTYDLYIWWRYRYNSV